MLNQVCSKCGVSFKRACLLALLADAGATVVVENCEHDFQAPPKEEKGIDYTKNNIYDAIGRPDLKPVEEAKQ